jgi:hypothetical protein
MDRRFASVLFGPPQMLALFVAAADTALHTPGPRTARAGTARTRTMPGRASTHPTTG